MTRPDIDGLKANAFALSRILATYHVKLSSQQCLDVLTRLATNMPFEALVGAHGTDRTSPADAVRPAMLADWLDIAKTFCQLAESLDYEAVNTVAFPRSRPLEHLHSDAKSYLLARGDAAARFARSAQAFVTALNEGEPKRWLQGIQFTAQTSEPVQEGKLATLRMQHPGQAAGFPSSVGDLDWKEGSAPLLYGAEARVELTTVQDEQSPFVGTRHTLMPGVRLIYEVCSQTSLKAFGEVLRKGQLDRFWAAMPPMQVETKILLSRHHTQDLIAEAWQTSEAGAPQRLAAFCEHASQLDEEADTPDWPPLFTLSTTLERQHTDDDLRLAFRLLCVHQLILVGESGGWKEILGETR